MRRLMNLLEGLFLEGSKPYPVIATADVLARMVQDIYHTESDVIEGNLLARVLARAAVFDQTRALGARPRGHRFEIFLPLSIVDRRRTLFGDVALIRHWRRFGSRG